MGILEFLGSPFKGLVDSVGGIIDNLTTSDEEKLEAKKKLLEVQSSFQLEMAKADTEFAKAQAQVVTAEAESQSWIARNWRPLTMLMFAYIIFHNFILAPLFKVENTPIPENLWDIIQVGLSGYIIGRSAEKVIPGVVTALKNK